MAKGACSHANLVIRVPHLVFFLTLLLRCCVLRLDEYGVSAPDDRELNLGAGGHPAAFFAGDAVDRLVFCEHFLFNSVSLLRVMVVDGERGREYTKRSCRFPALGRVVILRRMEVYR